VDAPAVEKELRRRVDGEVRFDAGSKAMYAVDGGNYRQVPIGVVAPKSVEDVIATIDVCREFGAPFLSRGGGTSLAGQCCNTAIVVDWTKYLNHIVELNPTQRFARVQPGTICDTVRKAAAPHNLTWGPDPATHTHCVFGGMIGNNSCGAHAQMAGKAVDNVEELDILLFDGTRMTAGWTTDDQARAKIAAGGRDGDIYRKLLSLRERYAGLVREKYPKIPRRVSGYNLDSLLPDENGRWNVGRALVGSEGTLVTVLEAKVRLIDARAQRVIVMLGYPDVYHAADHVMDVLPFDPVALEGLDEYLVHNIKKKGGPHAKYLHLLPPGKGWLLCEIGCDTREEALERAHELMQKIQKASHPPSVKLFDDKEEQEHIWIVRESGLGATAFVPGKPLTWEGWEDSAVAPEKLGAYLRDLCKLYEKYGYESTLYGHFGQGCVHCRLNFDFRSDEGIRHYRNFMEEATDLVTSYDGSLSGEHGDGQSKAEFLYKMFGPELIEAFREYKSIWDPDWKMNPGRIVDPDRIDENLRIRTYPQWEPETHFKFPDDHGKFSHAVLRCVGVGKCRRMEGQSAGDNTMCPSYMVTREEADATRGRAHQLWEMLQGGVIAEGWKDENVKEALDLCLSCKGCKGDCPVNVDMATYKAEFLSHYWEGRLRPRHAYAFGYIDQWARLASIAPGFVNLFTQLPGLSYLAKKAAGMPSQRQIPAFAPEPFQGWWRKRGPKITQGPQVVLWPDTFNNFFMPETARAAVEVLEHAGYQVVVPEGHVCCGRPLYDYGFLDTAKRYLEKNLEKLRPYYESGTPIVALEPSCCSVFRDELRGMLPEHPGTEPLRNSMFTLSEFLEKKAKYTPPKLRRQAIVQAHCHHKAIMRIEEEEKLVEKIGLDAKFLNSGCCGMAGSFGYEEDKYDVSVACGEHKLLPEVRKAGMRTIVMADGFSCKEQIAQQTNRKALHLAEVISMGIRHGEFGAPGLNPEDGFVKPREKAIRRSMLKSGAVAAAVIAGLAYVILKKNK
jgi:FAD/FMN-containing dehydrogenase/Fe-S oxidoreductase